MFKIYSNIKFNENLFIRSGFVPCGRTAEPTDGETGQEKLIVVFRNFTNAPKKTEASRFMDF
jgi:hypothetical protein